MENLEVLVNPERPPVVYDKVWKELGWQKPKMTPRYSYIISELKRFKVKAILDIGCGDGTLLSLCRDNGFVCYGFDFSSVAIEICKKGNKLENVWVGNALDKKNYIGGYDAYLATQLLEHIVRDKDVIKNLRPNIPFIFALPRWANPGDNHVRKFRSDGSIVQRYGEIVDIKSIKFFDARRVVVSMTKE